MKTFIQGGHYFLGGFKDICHRRTRWYVVMPLAINFLIFGGIFYYCLYQSWGFITIFSQKNLPSWLSSIEWLLKTIQYFLIFSIISILFAGFTMLATLIANLVGAPFNSLLSARLSVVMQHPVPDPPFIKMMSATVWREIVKFKYYFPRVLVVGVIALIFYFIPLLHVMSPIILYFLSAWMMAIQYTDYAADNQQIPFSKLLLELKQHRLLALGFGFTAVVFSSIPFLNLLVMPVAVLGATRMWHALVPNGSNHEVIIHNQKDRHTPW